MRIKYLITDMDGVVFDRMPLYRKIFENCLYLYGVSKEISGNYYHDTLGMSLRLQMKGALELQKLEAGEEEISEMVGKYWEMVSGNETKLFPGVQKIWNDLKNRGMNILASTTLN